MATVYEIVTNTIIEKLTNGVIPWRRPWTNRMAVNWITQKPYRGINALLLDPGEYATKKRILENGGWIKKDQLKKYNIATFYKEEKKENKETGKEEIVKRIFRFYKVWEINTQVTGLESRRKDEVFEHEPIEEAELTLAGYKDIPKIKYAPGRAYYNPLMDFISVPPLKDYKEPEEYYSTAFHEAAHSTGHKKRLNRKTLTENAAFGSEVYSQEELVAEIGAAMLCNIARIDHAVINNQAAYINGWLTKLKGDKTLIMIAAAQAQKAVDYIIGKSFKENNEEAAS